MLRKVQGFTVVELLIIISVMGILVAIAVVGWGGAASGSRDRTRESDTRQWVNTFNLYKSRFIVWPALPGLAGDDTTTKAICLGEPLSTTKRCGQSSASNGSTATYRTITDTDYTNLKTEIAKVGNFPLNNSPEITSVAYRTAGPVIMLAQETTNVSGTTNVKVTGVFINFFEGKCPTGMDNLRSVTYPSPTALNGAITTFLTGLPTTDQVPRICAIKTDFTYTPS